MIGKQTTLDLNGPILSFIQQPQSVSVSNSGSATFVGIATAFFPEQDPPNPATNTGTIEYRWYSGGSALSDGTFQGATITGSGTTTLTITNATSPAANGLRLFVGVDYVPSAYSQPVGSAVTVGTGRSTGNAVNEILNSNTATLTVNPVISITAQSGGVTIAQGRTATFSVTASSNDNTSVSYQWYIAGSPVSNGTSGQNTISGATTNILTVTTSGNTPVATSSVYVSVSHPTAGNSPVTSNTVTLSVLSAREIVNVETFIEGGGSGASLSSVNLFNGGTVTLTANSTEGLTSFYASEKDLDVIMEVYGSKGLDSGGFAGGAGGKSVVRFTMRRNEEYIITRLPQANGSGGIFLYRKSRLILVCGSGGNAGSGGAGGGGGGVNVAGAPGSGRGAGNGGGVFSPGSLPSTGIFGSTVQGQPTYSGDTKASTPDGGRVLPCPRGEWTRTGYSPCQDLGFVQFYRANGSIVSNTARIDRGFKAGYGIRQTAGRGINGGGNGGGGATGGQGGNNGGGGGGASGYTDGSVNIISSQQGVHRGQATVIIRTAN